jgi:hypothetical protein
VKWTEREIARTLALQIFHRKQLVVVPNCGWPGSECDIFVVRHDLRLVDVEIKISRSDLKADAVKEKWFEPYKWLSGNYVPPEQRIRVPRTHPHKIWKHYSALPDSIWKDDLAASISPHSGILLLREHQRMGCIARVHRQAKPNKEAQPVSAADVVDIARLVSVRLWESYAEVDEHRRLQSNQLPESKP